MLKSLKIMNKIAFSVVILLFAILTNPSKIDHQNAVKEELKILIQEDIPDGAIFADSIIDSMVDIRVKKEVKRNNFIIFSTTKTINHPFVGIGAFGFVFCFIAEQ